MSNKYKILIWIVFLALLAGCVNAVAIFGCEGIAVSHITGMISRSAISISSGETVGLAGILSIILLFFVGAVTAGIATGERAFHLRKTNGVIIFAIGILILTPLFLDVRHSLMMLSFLMGLQNGMVVSVRGILVRSTHMTGNLTDLGVYIGYRIRGNKSENAYFGLVPCVLIIGFILGGVIGVLLYNLIGIYVLIVLSLSYILMGIAYFHMRKTSMEVT